MSRSDRDALERYLAKLERRAPMPDRDREALMSLPGTTIVVPAGRDIVTEGSAVTRCAIIDTGFVSRAKTIKSNARQIVGINMSGDAVDLQRVLFGVADHTIHAHTETVILSVAHEDILALTETHPSLMRMLWQDTLVDAAIFREWTANLGRRRARERLAHFFLELGVRSQAIGALRDNRTYDLPLTQSHLADALGLSLVHLNKSLQSLRREGLLTIVGREVTLEQRDQLIEISGFDPDYLSLGRQSDAVLFPSPIN